MNLSKWAPTQKNILFRGEKVVPSIHIELMEKKHQIPGGLEELKFLQFPNFFSVKEDVLFLPCFQYV